MPSKAAIAFLSKASKGIKGGIDVEALFEALPLLGWKIERMIASYPLDGSRLSGALKLPTGHRFWGGVSEVKTLAHARTGSLDDLARLIASRARVEPFKKGPAPPLAEGEILIRGLGIGASKYDETVREIQVGLAWIGLPALHVWSDIGEVIFTGKVDVTDWKSDHERLVVEPLGEKGSDRFWSFAYKSGLKERAAKLLAALGAAATEVLRPASARSLKGTGTCPACFGNVKLHEGTMMRHGWRVGGRRYKGAHGMSWHSGPCFGFHHLPFEKSPNGTIEYVAKVLVPNEKRIHEEARHLATRPPLKVEGLIRREVIVLEPSNLRYETEWGYRVRQNEAEQRAIRREIEEREKRIKTWKPAPLPG